MNATTTDIDFLAAGPAIVTDMILTGILKLDFAFTAEQLATMGTFWHQMAEGHAVSPEASDRAQADIYRALSQYTRLLRDELRTLTRTPTC